MIKYFYIKLFFNEQYFVGKDFPTFCLLTRVFEQVISISLISHFAIDCNAK